MSMPRVWRDRLKPEIDAETRQKEPGKKEPRREPGL